jgi:hypothetical protein
LADPELEAIRHEADMVALPVTAKGKKQLEALSVSAEALKTAWLKAGQPD